ncbi:MAG: hypothetical protein WA639_00950 [Candidatus Acidiferrum sp.]
MRRLNSMQHLLRYFLHYALYAIVVMLGASPSFAQSQVATQAESQWSRELEKYPGLLPELEKLIGKLQQNVQLPASRSESRLLPLLPESTVYYAALPNYGDSAQQALAIFRQELKESPVLHDWWTHGDLATSGPKIEEAMEKFGQLHQFLGNEIVFSGSMDAKHKPGTFVAFAEIRKLGLDKFIEQEIAEAGGASKAGVQVFDQQGLDKVLAILSKDLLVLVRSDFVIATTDLAMLRSFNASLKPGAAGQFAATPFGQKIAQEYQGGATVLAAADLRNILKQVATGQAAIGTKDSQETFHRSGFADMKYAVWKRTTDAGQSVSQGELSFSAPRHGAAAWLAKPAPLGSLDFVSPRAFYAMTVVLTSLPQMFDDIKEITGPSKAGTFAMIAGGEKGLNLSLKDDLLSQLSGEITAELDSVSPQPVWKAILKVNDVDHLQKTLTTLLAVGQLPTEHAEQAGVTYYTVRVPSQKNPTEMAYTFLDGYLIVASSPQDLFEAMRLHGSGESLAKSKKFLASLPPGRSPEASALFYQDPIAMGVLQARQLFPQLADSLAQFSKDAVPSVTRVYGEESAIRETSNSSTLDFSMPLVVAAIAIPNLLRSRIAANEASAVGSLRSVNTAQVTYAATYPQRGFAPTLATFGSDPHAATATSAEHAGLLDESLANASCIGEAWCTKSGYQFRVTAFGKLQPRKEYVAVATPVDPNTGTRSFCSTSDAIIRFKLGPPVIAPLSVWECRAWAPLQ